MIVRDLTDDREGRRTETAPGDELCGLPERMKSEPGWQRVSPCANSCLTIDERTSASDASAPFLEEVSAGL